MQTQTFEPGQSARYVSDYLPKIAGKVGTIIRTGHDAYHAPDEPHTVALLKVPGTFNRSGSPYEPSDEWRVSLSSLQPA